MSRGDHNADLLDGFGELVRLDRAVIVEVEVLEGLEEDGFLVGVTAGLLRKLLLEGLLETARTRKHTQTKLEAEMNDLIHVKEQQECMKRIQRMRYVSYTHDSEVLTSA